MQEIKRILIVNRLSVHSREAVKAGVSLAKRYGAELAILRVISNPVDLEAINVPELFWKSHEYQNYLNLREQYMSDLDKAVRQVVKDGFPIKEFVTDKEPVKEIIRLVREERIDLIVLLAQQEGFLEHILFGGQNDALVRKLPCSIMFIKHEPKPVSW